MRRTPLAILACLALTLGGTFAAGCGGDDENDSGDSATPPASLETSTSEGTGGTSPSDAAAVGMKDSKFADQDGTITVTE